MLTEELLPVCFKIFELSRKFSIDSNYSNINSIGSLLNPKSSFHTLVKSLFALQPVRLLNLLESSISKPHSDYLKQIYLEETASSELLNTDEALEKIVHLNSHSWKFLLVKLEAFLDHSKTEPFALFETMLLAFSRGEISMSTLLVVLENIDSRFGLDYRIFSWTEYIIKHIENPTSIEGWIQNVFSDATKFNAFCEFISTLLLSFITRNEINGNYNRICFDFIEQIIIIRIRLLDSYNNTIDPESIKRNLLFNISLLIPFANFIQSHPAESKVIEVSKILLRSLSCKLLHSKDQEWHFNLIFDLLCWISDDIKKEFKNGFFAMLRESRSVLDFPEFCSDRISRILPFQVSSRYNDIEKGNDLKPYTWLEEWDESINSDHAASLPLSLFGAAVIPKKERTYQSLIKTGWRNSL